jgi:hypothetical protein
MCRRDRSAGRQRGGRLPPGRVRERGRQWPVEGYPQRQPGDYNLPALDTLLDQVVAWSAGLAPLRAAAGAVAAA